MITENLSTLKIHKLTQAQYNRELDAGSIDPSAMYLTPADEETDPTVPAWAKEPAKPTYTADEVGADASGTASSLISTHNSDTTAHADIRAELAIMTSEFGLINDKITALSNNKLNASELQTVINTHNTASNAHSDIREQISQLSVDKADKSAMTLGVHTDGLVYLFINGAPQGNGLDIKADVIEGDVFGYVDENNVIVLNGALAEGTYTIKYEMDDGSTVEIGDLVLDNNVYYSVTNNLTNCTNSNNTVQMVEGGSYSAIITAKSGYEMSSIKVTMGGVDISSTAVSGGGISIANVTGNIVITAVATEVATTPKGNLADPTSADWQEGYRLSISGGNTSALAGHTATNYIPAEVGDVLRVKGLRIKGYDSNGTDVRNAAKIVAFDANKGNLGGAYGMTNQNTSDEYGLKVTVEGDVSEYTLMLKNDGSQTSASVAYIRIDGFLMDGYTKNDVVITINEEITDDAPVAPTYKNLADPTSADWLAGHRYSVSQQTIYDDGLEGVIVTNYIPVNMGDIVYISGAEVSTSYGQFAGDSSKNKLLIAYISNGGSYWSYESNKITILHEDVKFIRLTLSNVTDANSVVIVKEGSSLPDEVSYSVTNTLTSCTSSNAVTTVTEGENYSATITANSGYKLKSLTVTMGGTDISSTAVSGGKINIANVTGNIIITAVAEKIVVNYTNLFVPSEATLNTRLNSSAAVTATDGYVLTNFMDVSGKTPFTASTKIYMKGVDIKGDGSSRIFVYKTTGTTYTSPHGIVNASNMAITDEGNGVISITGLNSAFASGVVRAVMCLKVSSSAIAASDIEDIVITIDEPIV